MSTDVYMFLIWKIIFGQISCNTNIRFEVSIQEMIKKLVQISQWILIKTYNKIDGFVQDCCISFLINWRY